MYNHHHMDIFFTDPTDIPLPPEEVRIRKFLAQPWGDDVRVRVYLELTPFLKRPNGDIVVYNAQGEELANISIIETMDPKMEFTLHLRGAERVGPFSAAARIFYLEDAPEGEDPPPDQRPRQVVDRAELTFDFTEQI